MKVVRCSSLPETALEILATQLIAEFGHLYPTWNVATAKRELSEDSGQGLPLHLVAVQDDQVLGITSIIPDDEATGWESKDWWLANVLVLPEHREQGIGKELIGRAIEIARESGAHELHLVTDTAENWYLKQGWESVGECDVHHTPMVVMHYELSSCKRS